MNRPHFRNMLPLAGTGTYRRQAGLDDLHGALVTQRCIGPEARHEEGAGVRQFRRLKIYPGQAGPMR